ncbi:hypothetical protein BO71DRAFT_368146 [Aspergillus ellipticus CBS 707.79]|uniref:Paramyosin n=1 Tax=Aspergillus ellipticus CBS 707.79 TaxID=1448320 RepID=A0A319E0I6_9EURO|nr:hypothetical protein BO71DRAFT_368146 [Aspergillus ellipticus CBS 707.79]
MDPPTATTRDPRLASRSSSNSGRPSISRPLSLDTPSSDSPVRPRPGIQQPGRVSPVDTQNASADQFIHGISDLVQTAVIAANGQSEKERLQKRKDTTESLLKKARAHSSFPSTAAFFSQSQKDEDFDLARVDYALKRHATNYKQLENALRAKFGSIMSMDAPKADDKINQMQHDVQVARNGLSSAHTEISKLRDYNITLENKVKQLQDKMAPLEWTSTNHASTLNAHAKLTKENSERVAKMSTDLDTVLIPQKKENDSASFKIHLDELRTRTSGLDLKIESLQKSQREYCHDFDKINQKMDTQDVEKARTLAALNTRLVSVEKQSTPSVPSADDAITGQSAIFKELESRLQKLEADFSGQYKLDPMLGSQLQDLKGQFGKMQEIQEMKDDLQLSQLEELKKAMEIGSRELEKLKGYHNRVTQEIKDLSQSQGKTNHSVVHEQQIMTLSSSLRNTHHILESVRVGLHSLESRYNSISTESIIKNMVVAMQEMYPSTAQLTEQVSVLRSRFEREIPPLQAKADHVQYVQPNQIEQIQKDMTSQLEELNRLKTEHTNLSQSLAPVLDQITAQNQDRRLTADDLQQVQAETSSLTTRLNEHTARVDNYLTARKREEDSLFKQLTGLFSDGKGDLHGQVNALSEKLDQLAQRFPNTKDEVKALSDKQKDLAELICGSKNPGLLFRVEEIAEKQESLSQRLTDMQKDDSQGQARALAGKHKSMSQSVSSAQISNFRDELNALNGEQKILAKKMTDVQARNQGDFMALRSCPDELKSMLDRVCQVEDAALSRHRALAERVDLIEERFDDLVKTLEFSESQVVALSGPDENTNPLKLEENPPNAENARTLGIANSSPALTLQQKKKKRPRPSALSEEDRSSVSRPESPRPIAAASPSGGNATPSTDRRAKKKKKRKTISID